MPATALLARLRSAGSAFLTTLRRGRGTTYDNQHWDGLSSFMASMQEAGWTLAADLAWLFPSVPNA